MIRRYRAHALFFRFHSHHRVESGDSPRLSHTFDTARRVMFCSSPSARARCLSETRQTFQLAFPEPLHLRGLAYDRDPQGQRSLGLRPHSPCYHYQAWSIPLSKPVRIRLCRAGFPFTRKSARCFAAETITQRHSYVKEPVASTP